MNPRQATVKVEAYNAIYEGAVYESTPGESVKSHIYSHSTGTPSAPSADSTSCYVDITPSLPPPRKGLVSTQPKLEPPDKTDVIKASFEQLELPPPPLSGDEYMDMNGVHLDGKTDAMTNNGCMHADKKKCDGEYIYVTLN